MPYPYAWAMVCYHAGAMAGVLYIEWAGWQGKFHHQKEGDVYEP